MALGYQLGELLKEGLLKEYLEVDDGEQQGEVVLGYLPHEIPIHAELNTISGGGSTAAKRKRYARAVMTLEMKSDDDTPDPDLYFTKADLVGLVPHDNDLTLISVFMVGRKVHSPHRSRELGRRAVLVHIRQLAVIPRPVEASRQMLNRIHRGPCGVEDTST